jgi:hypothetical protein
MSVSVVLLIFIILGVGWRTKQLYAILVLVVRYLIDRQNRYWPIIRNHMHMIVAYHFQPHLFILRADRNIEFRN